MDLKNADYAVADEKVFRDLAEIKADLHIIRTRNFWLIFGALIATALGLASLLAKGFGWY